MEIHYIRPEMKSPYDSITIKDGKASISVWRDLPPDPSPAKIECLGYQWLLTGRGQKMGLGASEVFKALPELQSISLELVEVDFQSNSRDKKGKIERQSVKRPYLTMSIDRAKIDAHPMNQQQLKADIQKDTARCTEVGRQLISTKEIKL